MVEAETNTTLNIEGMNCSNCALEVTKSLPKKGMENVYVDSTVGVSLSNATKVAIQSAQIILLKHNDLSVFTETFLISKHTLITIKQNLFWAFFYNIVAIPATVMGLLNPMMGALIIAFSDVIVIGNSIQLRTKKLN